MKKNPIEQIEKKFNGRFTFIESIYLHSHSPTYKNSKFGSKIEITIRDNFDKELHSIKIVSVCKDILTTELNVIIQSKRNDIIDNIINING